MMLLMAVTLAGAEVPQPASIKAGIVINALRMSTARRFIVLPFNLGDNGLRTVLADLDNEPDETGEREPAGDDARPHVSVPARGSPTSGR